MRTLMLCILALFVAFSAQATPTQQTRNPGKLKLKPKPRSKAKGSSWRGYLVHPKGAKGHRFVSQHPMMTFSGSGVKQRYFNVVDARGKRKFQAILLVPAKARMPKDPSKLLVIFGKGRKIGPKPAKAPSKRRVRGKRSYRGFVIRMKRWKYAK